jgi:hypothetical protein
MIKAETAKPSGYDLGMLLGMLKSINNISY